MKDLLVGTILAKDDSVQRQWLNLQLRCLAETTKDFDHITVIMNGVNGDDDARTKLIEPEDKTLKDHHAHLMGLNTLLELFKEKQGDYRDFLIIDSDAFPIRKEWLPHLLKEMGNIESFFDNSGMAIPSLANKTYHVALALRPENLEKRLHASVLFIRKKFLNNVSFNVDNIGADMLGMRECDIHLPYYEGHRSLAFPLIRTNQHNVHPLCCGIYFNMFYHHGSGSRAYNMRGIKYWKDVEGICEVGELSEMLFDNPTQFISDLAGWTPSRYAVL
jgi:hypothetical protein